jgi:hypothetical protein
MFKHRLSGLVKTMPTAVVCAGFILMAGCNDQEVSCHWSSNPIRIDGKSGDWSGIPVTIFEEQGAVLALANDSENLYVQFRTRDRRWVRTIRRSGLTIYVNNKAKKDKDFFVRFKGGHHLADFQGRQEPVDSNSAEEHLNPWSRSSIPFNADTTEVFTCYQKDKVIEKPIPLDGSEGPSAGCDTSFGFYTYELSIPLSESTVRYYGIGAAPGQKISIGVEWGGMGDFRRDRPGGMTMGGPPGGGFPGGGGPPGGGMGGRPGGMGGRGEDRRGSPEKQEVWLKTALAAPSVNE